MERLWTPWRMEYIRNVGGAGCIFCEKRREGDDREGLVLLRGGACFLVMNKYPYNNGHLMVAPYRHVELPSALSKEEGEETFRLLAVGERLLKAAYRPEGFNVGANIGQCAGAGVLGHFHLHIVPRWSGDTNFMPVFGETRVLPQSLEQSYDALREILDRGEGGSASSG